MAGKLALLVVSTVLSVVLFEGVARVFIRPSLTAYGTLLGRELPPVRVIPLQASTARTDVPASAKQAAVAAAPTSGDPAAAAAQPAAIRSDDAVAWADLEGVFREDPLLGYAPLEHATSPHGWWRSNNIGARSTTDTTPQAPHGRRRVLVFGESYASGSRVRQEEAWPTVLGAGAADLEVVNLGVDGYGMGQALLRFREVTRSTDYDVALLVFVPTADLWRDVNTIRSVARRSWNAHTVMPRFVIEGGRLALVRGPYEVGSDVYSANALGLSDTLRHHLRAYDRFYFRTKYESPLVIGDLVLWKIAASLYFTYARGQLLRSMHVDHIDLDSEAMRVSRKIFEAMRDETGARRKRFALVLLPESHELRHIRQSERNWQRVVERLCDGIDCIDLGPALARVPAEQIDRGQDRTHYGRRANRVVAVELERELKRRL